MLVSDFSDYYDHVVLNGFADVDWRRFSKLVEIQIYKNQYLNLIDYHRIPAVKYKASDYYHQEFTSSLCFCGTGYLVHWEKLPPHYIDTYTPELLPFTEEYKAHLGLEYISKNYNPTFTSTILEELHIRLNTPIFEIRSINEKRDGSYFLEILKNPKLADYKFYNKKSGEETYQDIITYFSHLNKPLEPTPITDEIKAKLKGHGKLSFKNGSPGKKKLNRKRNKKRKRNASR